MVHGLLLSLGSMKGNSCFGLLHGLACQTSTKSLLIKRLAKLPANVWMQFAARSGGACTLTIRTFANTLGRFVNTFSLTFKKQGSYDN